MLVYKFGGTSVGSVVNINHVKDIIDNNDRKIVVLSAMSGTTNALIEISNLIKSNKNEVAIERIKTLNENYNTAVYDLLHNKSLRQEVSDYVNMIFKNLI